MENVRKITVSITPSKLLTQYQQHYPPCDETVNNLLFRGEISTKMLKNSALRNDFLKMCGKGIKCGEKNALAIYILQP